MALTKSDGHASERCNVDLLKQTTLSPAILAIPARNTKASSQPQSRSRKRLHNRRLAAKMASDWMSKQTWKVLVRYCSVNVQGM
jgi:hypothetical protein